MTSLASVTFYRENESGKIPVAFSHKDSPLRQALKKPVKHEVRRALDHFGAIQITGDQNNFTPKAVETIVSKWITFKEYESLSSYDVNEEIDANLILDARIGPDGTFELEDWERSESVARTEMLHEKTQRCYQAALKAYADAQVETGLSVVLVN